MKSRLHKSTSLVLLALAINMAPVHLSAQEWTEASQNELTAETRNAAALKIDHMRKAHEDFLRSKNKETANAFFNSIPVNFSLFNRFYGFETESGGPLSNLSMAESLSSLVNFIEPERLVKKFVSLASTAKWDADNVFYLQEAYVRLFFQEPALAIGKIKDLPPAMESNAIAFLIDGPHPSKPSDSQMAAACSIDQNFCKKMRAIFDRLIAQRSREH